MLQSDSVPVNSRTTRPDTENTQNCEAVRFSPFQKCLSSGKLVLCCCLLAGTVRSAIAQQDDPVAEKLAEAKQAYQLLTDKASVRIETALKQAEIKARQTAGDAGVQLIGLQRQRYEEYGCTPLVCGAAIYRQRSAAQQSLLKAYQIAFREYQKANDATKVAALKLELGKIRPSFMDDPAFGGLKPYGNARIETHNGYLTLTGTGQKRAGVVSGRTDLGAAKLTVALCGSEDVDGWIGVRINPKGRTLTGHTSRIFVSEGGVTSGFSAVDFHKAELGVKSANRYRNPNQMFQLQFAFDNNKKTLWTRLDGGVVSGVIHRREASGGFGIFVSRGTLIVKTLYIGDG